MDGRRARLIGPVLDSVPRLTRRPANAPTAAGELKTGWAALLGVGWPLVFVLAAAIEPPPADPNAATPLLVDLGTAVLFGALVITAVSAASRLRSAAFGGIGAGGVGLAFSITCPLSSHHGFGMWWVGQMAMLAAMLVVSIAALGQRARAS
jgi:peptidoglycan/LPS O-acetylase OafA/YrhL